MKTVINIVASLWEGCGVISGAFPCEEDIQIIFDWLPDYKKQFLIFG